MAEGIASSWKFGSTVQRISNCEDVWEDVFKTYSDALHLSNLDDLDYFIVLAGNFTTIESNWQSG
jgi:hypothetical protein